MRVPNLVNTMKFHLGSGVELTDFKTFVATRYPEHIEGRNLLYYMPVDKNYVIVATDAEWSLVETTVSKTNLLLVEVPSEKFKWQTDDRDLLHYAINGRERQRRGPAPKGNAPTSIYDNYPHSAIDYLYKDGVKITEIADRLNLPRYQLYRYFRSGAYQKMLDNEFA
jgi:hypothetical protein